MTVVQNAVRRPDGTTVNAAQISIVLKTTAFTTDGTVGGSRKVEADSQGHWSIDLVPNSSLTPSGTYYQVSEDWPGGHNSYNVVVPPTGGPFNAVQVLAATPPAVLGSTVAWSNVTDKPTFSGGGTSSAVTWTDVTGKPTTFPPSAHVHPQSDVTGLTSALAAKADTADLTSGLAGKANQTDLTSGLASKASLTHSHSQSDVTGLSAAFTGLETSIGTKANAVHGHAIADVSGLQAALAAASGGTALVSSVAGRTGDVTLSATDVSGISTVGKTGVYSDLSGKPALSAVATSNSYADLTGKPVLSTVAVSGSYTDLTAVPTTFPPAAHVHAQTDVTGLSTALSAKADQSSVTTSLASKADSSALTSGLAGKANTSHSHSGADITSGTVPFANLPTGTSSTSVAVGNHSHGTTYAALVHGHATSDVTGLDASLSAKADASALSGYATTSALTSGLAGKANTSHFHVASPVVTLADAATVATDASLGSTFRVTLGGNRTLGAPTNAVDGQRVMWELIQDATGSRTITLDAAFKFGTDVTAVTLSTTAAKRDFLGAVYNAGTSSWYVIAFAKGY